MPVQNKLSVKQIEHTKCPADKESLRLNDGDTVVLNGGYHIKAVNSL